MFKRLIWLVVMAAFFAFQTFVGAVSAAEIDVETRTVPLNAAGDTLTLSQAQVSEGKRLFNYACGQCHAGGITKTNFNVDLSPNSLALATPPRTNIEALVDYMKEPTTYDGLESIAEVHPALSSADVFPKMRNLTEDDLVAIAGHILTQPKVLGERWGAGKTRYST
jgi:photosystem II cytochrome c550